VGKLSLAVSLCRFIDASILEKSRMCAIHVARHSAQQQDYVCISEHTLGSVPSPVMNVANLLHSVLPLLSIDVIIPDIDLISAKYAVRSLLQKRDLISIEKLMETERHSVVTASVEGIYGWNMSDIWAVLFVD
jgi:hypothetical protein